MKAKVLAVAAAACGLLMGAPCVSVAQEASIQATVTILAPPEQPSVRVVAPEFGSDQEPELRVDASLNWGVQVVVDGTELVLDRGAGAKPGAAALTRKAWTAAVELSRVQQAPIRVILAAH